MIYLETITKFVKCLCGASLMDCLRQAAFDEMAKKTINFKTQNFY